jgi:hypothetical protein
VKLLLFVCLKGVLLTFVHVVVVVKPVLASANSGMKDSGHGGVYVDEQVTGGGSASAQDPPVEVETTLTRSITVSNVALVLHCTGAIERDAICGLLT